MDYHTARIERRKRESLRFRIGYTLRVYWYKFRYNLIREAISNLKRAPEGN